MLALMEKRHVFLLGDEQLLGESIQKVLQGCDDIRLSGPAPLKEDICAQVAEVNPDVVLITHTGDHPSNKIDHLTAQILDYDPTITVIHSTLDRNVVRVFTAREFPASASDLIEAILA